MDHDTENSLGLVHMFYRPTRAKRSLDEGISSLLDRRLVGGAFRETDRYESRAASDHEAT